MDRQEKELIKISVRNLVEFILRKGDLDNRRSAAFDREAMLKGGRIHRKIQKQMKASYRAEVPLKWEQEYEEFIISVEGRADGIIEEGDRTAIDEIKGVYMDLNYLEEPVEVHKAQAMCYAYIYASQTGKEEIQVHSSTTGGFREEIPWRGWNSLILTGRDSGSWSPGYTIPLLQAVSFLSRRLPASERPWPPCFLPSVQWDRDTETRFSI